jgi:hypothetical protein
VTEPCPPALLCRLRVLERRLEAGHRRLRQAERERAELGRRLADLALRVRLLEVERGGGMR